MNGEGSVLNIGSIVGHMPVGSAPVYSATKAAVDALTVALSKELGPRKIRVNSLDPGMVETEGFRSAGLDESEFRKTVEVADSAWPHRKTRRRRPRRGILFFRRRRLGHRTIAYRGRRLHAITCAGGGLRDHDEPAAAHVAVPRTLNLREWDRLTVHAQRAARRVIHHLLKRLGEHVHRRNACRPHDSERRAAQHRGGKRDGWPGALAHLNQSRLRPGNREFRAGNRGEQRFRRRGPTGSRSPRRNPSPQPRGGKLR